MADDIIDRLRGAARACHHGFPNGAGDSFPDPTSCGGCARLSEAAAEIERLRTENDDLNRQIDGLFLSIQLLNAQIKRMG